MKTQLLKIADISTTAGTQIRARIDADTVDQYAEAMRESGNKFPPVVVFHDGSQFVLADGFHRVMAASRNDFKDIEADVRKGTRADALKFALSANSIHGLRRTNADKRRSVEMALAEWPKLSDREIARICAVGYSLVGEVRKDQLPESDSCEPQHATRIGADGKERRMPRAESQPAPSNLATDPPAPVPAAPEPESTAPEPDLNPPCDLYAKQLEQLEATAIGHGTIEQLHAFKLELEVALRKVKQAILKA